MVEQTFEDAFVENFRHEGLQMIHEFQRHPVIPILVATTFGVNVQYWGLANMHSIAPETLRRCNVTEIDNQLRMV